MLRLNLIKRLTHFSLELQLEIEPAFTALFGPSGAGKTSTLNIIAGLDSPDSGEIVLSGRTLFSSRTGVRLKPQLRDIGYVFQESRLFPHLNVRQNLEFGLKMVHFERRQFSFEKIVQVSNLESLLTRMPASLSGGEKQRVALARAILASPKYLLMDEPLASLDLPTRLGFLKFLRDIHLQLKLPILYVSHDLANVVKFADSVIVLKSGKVRGHGTPAQMLSEMEAAPLLAGEDVPNIFEVIVTAHDDEKGVTLCKSGQMQFLLPRLNCLESEKLLLNIPASEILLAVEQPRGLSASNILRGPISGINRAGDRVLVEVNCGEEFTVEIVEATVKRLALTEGKEVFLIFKASSFRQL